MKKWTKRSLAALLAVLMAFSCAAFSMTAFANEKPTGENVMPPEYGYTCYNCGEHYDVMEEGMRIHYEIQTDIDWGWEEWRCPVCNEITMTLIEPDGTADDDEDDCSGGHQWEGEEIDCATTQKDGALYWICEFCGARSEKKEIIYKIASVSFAQKNYAYSGYQKKPDVIVKDSKGNVIDKSNYTVKYGTNKVIGTGTATVVFDGCYYDGTAKGTFKIIPAKMAAPTVTNAAKGFKISWKKAAGGVTGYEIWRSKAGGTYQKVKTIAIASTTTFTDSSDAANANGVKYAYKIRAYKKGHSYGAFSAAKVSYKVARPVAPTVTNSGIGKITVKWTKNAKASGYKIKYVTGTTTKTVTVTGAATVKKVLTVKQGAAYKVYVQAYKTVSGKTYHSCFSPAKSITTNKFIKYITTGKVNYRTAPGLGSTVKGSIPKGTTIQAVSGYGKKVDGIIWRKAFYKNAFYYVANGYLKKA